MSKTTSTAVPPKNQPPVVRTRAWIACVSCRRAHLKCEHPDNQMIACRRCVERGESTSCQYLTIEQMNMSGIPNPQPTYPSTQVTDADVLPLDLAGLQSNIPSNPCLATPPRWTPQTVRDPTVSVETRFNCLWVDHPLSHCPCLQFPGCLCHEYHNYLLMQLGP